MSFYKTMYERILFLAESRYPQDTLEDNEQIKEPSNESVDHFYTMEDIFQLMEFTLEFKHNNSYHFKKDNGTIWMKFLEGDNGKLLVQLNSQQSLSIDQAYDEELNLKILNKLYSFRPVFSYDADIINVATSIKETKEFKHENFDKNQLINQNYIITITLDINFYQLFKFIQFSVLMISEDLHNRNKPIYENIEWMMDSATGIFDIKNKDISTLSFQEEIIFRFLEVKKFIDYDSNGLLTSESKEDIELNYSY